MRACLLSCLLVLFACPLAQGADPVPEWIWSHKDPKDSDRAFFRKTIELTEKPKAATIVAACDNAFTLFVNGKQIGSHQGWESAAKDNLLPHLATGKNVIAIRGTNEGGIAAMIAQITLEAADGKKTVIVTDENWLSSKDDVSGWQKKDLDDSKWSKAHSFGKLGRAPWGAIAMTGVTSGPNAKGPGIATAEDAIKTLPGFKIERLYSVPKDEQGSWVSMTSDDKGRIIASDQYGGLYRVTPEKDAESTKIEKLEVDIGEAQGMLYTWNALYVVVNKGGKYQSGLYRVTDTNNDDQFDKVEMLKKIEGGGEHGPHGIRRGPDDKLYLIAGNFTKPPEGSEGRSPHYNWAEDLLLPRNPDGGGHDPHIMAPGGWLARTDKDGKEWELVCAGLRNSYDIDLNDEGEVFTFDSDMEWDTGTPWYRPTRVNHLVSGGEFGWRNGTGKWPEYYIDSLGAVVNIGLGSPTGVTFGTGAKFPAKYQQALFINDWTYGKIYAVHLTPEGASYTGTFETFIEGKPLPVTDIVVHSDGQLYFAIGGRKTQSGFYRVTYTGSESTAPAMPAKNEATAKARALRRQLEAYHVKKDPQAIDFAWPHLNSGDRAIRYAARVAIEHQDPALWQDRALAETKTTAALSALVALCRAGDKSLQPKVLAKLNGMPLERFTEDQLLAAARVYGLAFIRLGEKDDKGWPVAPAASLSATVAKRLAPLFPNQSESVNRELVQLLVFLRYPGVTDPGMKLLAAGQTQEEQLHYVLALRGVADLLSPEQRKAYFSWCNLAEASYRGGNSFKKFVQRIRQDAAEKLTPADRESLKDVIEGKAKVEVVKLETTRQFLHNWQMEDLLPILNEAEKGRSFEKGKAAYMAAQCYKCHRFAGEGGDTGPDITGVGNRFDLRYIAESLIVPSKAISDQYLATQVLTKDGEIITGRIMMEDDKELKLRTDPFALAPAVIPKSEIQQRQLAKVSEMPQGLINVLTKEEILDLIAYMRSAGKPDDKAFQK